LHDPQWAGSLVVSMQALTGAAHWIRPTGHMQMLLTQVAPVTQALPHMPQLAGLLVKSVQTPLQTVRPAGQTH
jgi:hypothetical protein